MDFNEHLNVLNKEQFEAVTHEGSPLLILAGAGSGKTRVITTKIAWLISQKHYDPYSILAVTFTKKAALEMKERAVQLEERASYAQIRTFHSFGAYFLRQYAVEAGIDKNFTVYDDDDMVTLVKKSIPQLKGREAQEIAHKISLAKDYGLTPESENLDTVAQGDEKFAEHYAAYQNRLRETGNVDFGDLIMLPYLVLKNNPMIKARINMRYRVILVDEYQDSNVAQFLLLQELSGINEDSGTYVCVVGDDDQSIYKFRGAEVQNILRFQEYFPNTTLIRLQTNYRSTPQILSLADSVVCKNEMRLGKTLVAANEKGKLPTLAFLPNQDDETDFCAYLIESFHKKGVPYSDWAILYRTNAQSLGFETEFLHKKIPYTVVGSLKFYEREEIKDALSYLSFVANRRDEIAFRRIVNKPARAIGTVTQDKIVEASRGVSILDGGRNVKLSRKAKEGFESFYSLIEELDSMLPEGPGETERIAQQVSLEKSSAINSEELNALVEDINANKAKESKAKKDTLAYFIEQLVQKSGLEEFHAGQDEIAGTQKVANLQELVNSAVFYPCTRSGLLDFLDHIELDRTLENDEESYSSQDCVTLITLHNTKGLEFNRVIITGMESGIFPREDKSGLDLEEERRLFYVGVTRARQELYLTSCQSRRMYGRINFMYPSVFLGEIDKKMMRVIGETSSFGMQSVDPVAKKWKVGASVYHDDYGAGYIIKANTTEDGEYVITVNFETGGTKKFLPKYQKSLILEE